MRRLFLSVTLILVSMTAWSKSTTNNHVIESKIDSLIEQMTLEEKVGMIHASSSFTSGGVERLGIPELLMSDGPHGVRFEHGRDWEPDKKADDKVSYLPTGICLASTWNADLGYQFGAVLGAEANARGKDVILGPGLNIIRTPLNGRNFEYLSEDPYLISRMVVGYIKGVQDQGIASCAKHFVANNQETERFKVNVEMSERALREIYLPGFKAAVQEAEVLTVMGAYNKFRGEWCMHNNYLAQDILKGEWAFDGVYMSDWNAVHDTRKAYMAGTDIEMGTDLDMLPNPDYDKFFFADSLLNMLKREELPLTLLDDKVRRILRVMYKTNTIGTRQEASRNTKEHQQLALNVAEEGIVLLKNKTDVLPYAVNKVKTIAVIGENAVREQHKGGGSSQVSALYEITPLKGIENFVGEEVEVNYYQGYKITRSNKPNEHLLEKALKGAAKADLVIFVGGWIHNYDPSEWGKDAYDNEGIDKPSLEMPYGQNELIENLLEVNENTALVLIGGGPMDMHSWLPRAKVLLQAWYPGMEGGTALANILFGKTNPSGKLPMTFNSKLESYSSHSIGEFPGENLVVNYKEGIYVGYRHFETKQIETDFPFGYGLSYTDFEFADLELINTKDKVKVQCMVTNTGTCEGKEVVQLYIHPVDPKTERPVKELKGFEKIALKSGESQQVTFELSANDFKYYDEASKAWKLDSGEYEIQIGNSVKDIKLKEGLVY